MASDAVKAAWITSVVGAVGVIIAAAVTGGFGLADSSSSSRSAGPTQPSVVVAPVAGITTPPNAAAVPSGYQGTWTGVVTQSNNVSYSLTLQIGSGNVGAAVGSWQVPVFGCSGELDLESGGGPLEIRQVTAFNPSGQCFSQFEIDVTLQGSDLVYEIKAVTEVNGQFVNGNPTLGDATLSPQ